MAEPRMIGIYRLISECGKGAYGIVYLAENTLTHQQVALKILHGKQQQRELDGLIRYRECRHPNLIQIHHIDRTPDGSLYYTMDAADSRDPDRYEPDTLARRMESRIQPSELKEIILSLADGIASLHQAGLIHRDIKPENIFSIRGIPVLGDIGLTAEAGHATLIGTPAFMPADVLQGKRPADETCDIYALGMVTYCALTGLQPSDFPRLPKGLPLEARTSISASRAACEGRISLEQFRDMLSGEKKVSRHGMKYLIAALMLILTAAVLFTGWSMLKRQRYSSSAIHQEQTFELRLEALLRRYPEPPAELREKAVERYKSVAKPVPLDDFLARLGELDAQIPLIAANAKRYPNEMQLTVLESLLKERLRLSQKLSEE